MFLYSPVSAPRHTGFPRVRGDVPHIRIPGPTHPRFSPRARGCSPFGVGGSTPPRSFSPRARGCSPDDASTIVVGSVFPACAGMFPETHDGEMGRRRFPRVRGDVPRVSNPLSNFTRFSPRARGCSTFTSAMNPITKVFPACAGMFPPHPTPTPLCRRFPRVRGDVPCSAKVRSHSAMFSPRARGCSGFLFSVDVDADVFPACAGMFLQ